jgi:hypothetical protein
VFLCAFALLPVHRKPHGKPALVLGKGEGARACDKSDWGFDLPERIFETRPDGG